MKTSIREPKEFEKIVEQLIEKGIFESRKDVMLFVGALGFSNNKKKQIKTFRENPIKTTIFSGDFDLALIKMIALSDSNFETNIFEEENSDKITEIFEEYCNRGFELLKKNVFSGLDIEVSFYKYYSELLNPQNIIQDISNLGNS